MLRICVASTWMPRAKASNAYHMTPYSCILPSRCEATHVSADQATLCAYHTHSQSESLTWPCVQETYRPTALICGCNCTPRARGSPNLDERIAQQPCPQHPQLDPSLFACRVLLAQRTETGASRNRSCAHTNAWQCPRSAVLCSSTLSSSPLCLF